MSDAKKTAARKAPPNPKEIVEYLDRFVTGQDKAKQVLAVAVYNHYKRIFQKKRTLKNKSAQDISDPKEEVCIEKSNLLLLGPTGCGKTHLVQSVAKLLDVPFAVCDCALLTGPGYYGGNVETVLSDLLKAAKDDHKKAERGIVYLDEVDKLAATDERQDRWGRDVQRAFLKIVEGSVVSWQNSYYNKGTLDTTEILFVASGAFVNLQEIIKGRMEKLGALEGLEIKDGEIGTHALLDRVEACDLVKYGFMPEFIGRFPIIASLQPLSEDMMVRILTEQENSVLSQFQKLFKIDQCELTFDEAALRAVGRKASEMTTGARGLRGVIEDVLKEAQYEIPGTDIIAVHITEDVVKGKAAPVYARGQKNQEDTLEWFDPDSE